MTHLKMHTQNNADENYKKLAALFPNAVTETITGYDENGKAIVERAIDKDVLMQEISCKVVEGNEERYQFTWPDKKKSVLLANAPINKTLRPCREESVDFDNTENLYIEGDNLEVLKLLQETYLGKIKMIYIDPPYNTCNDFVYEDDFAQSTDEYIANSGQFDDEGNRLVANTESNGRFHTDWLNMIYPRVKLAKDLLSDDGVILVSIDYNENFNMRKVLDEIFGNTSFIGEIYWESKTKSQNTVTSYNKLQPKAEMLFVYSKEEKRRFNLIKKGEKSYPLSDEKGKYREHCLEVMNANGIRGRETMVFDISDGVSTVSLPEGKQWKLGQDQVATYKNAGDLFIRDGKVIIKMRPEYERVETTEPFWGFFSKDMGTAESAKKELKNLIGTHGFETVKPLEIIKRLIYHCTNSDDYILDFFSGSATTAHAVMQLNAEDGGHRKFVMVQLPEETTEKSEAYKAGYKNICEIGKERIRRAGQKIVESFQLSVDSYKGEKSGKLQRTSSLAEVNGNGEGSLFDSEEASNGGKIRSVGSAAAGGGVDSVEHRGRSGAELKERVRTVSEDSTRFKVGTGNPAFDLRSSRLSERNGNSEGNESSFGNRKNDNISNENSGNYKLKTDNCKLDIGFRVLKIDTSNMEDVFYSPQELQNQDFFKSNIKTDRTGEDLLFQVMLDLGVLLSSKIETKNLGGNKVFCVEGNYLMACFDTDISEETVTQIAKEKPYYFVMRDPSNSLNGDSLITNFEQIFATYSPDTVRKVL